MTNAMMKKRTETRTLNTTENKAYQSTTIRLTIEQYEELRLESYKTRQSMTAIISAALAQYLHQNKEKTN